MPDYQKYRREYEVGILRREDLLDNPLKQFALWLQQAEDACPQEVTSMTLATSGADGQPSARIVLLKSFDEHGLVWYTDSRSQKGQELATNPKAALLFYWPPLERQVRVTGQVSQLSSVEADAYFHSRPIISQLSAASSQQSKRVANRAVLEERVATLQATLTQASTLSKVPRPSAWLGYRLSPQYFEFWQGRPNRLHDRFAFAKVATEDEAEVNDNTSWRIERLQP